MPDISVKQFVGGTIAIACIVLFFCCDVGAQTPGRDAQPKLLSSEPFRLSDDAIAAGIDGTVSVSLSVDKDGTVKNVLILAGPAWPCNTNPSDLLRSVREAIKENIMTARFSPQLKDGKPRDAELSLSFAIGNAYRDAVKEDRSEAAVAAGHSPKIIDAGLVKGRATRLPKPPYPAAAKANRVSGEVHVQVLIGEDGKVKLAGTIGGHPSLQAEARDAACMAEFSPTSIAGNPVKVKGVISYSFYAP